LNEHEEIGPALWVGAKDAPGRVTFPYAIWRSRGCDPVEAMAASLGRAGVTEGVFHLGDGRREINGVVVPVRFVNSTGLSSRPPNPGKLEELLTVAAPEIVSIAWQTPDGAAFVALLEARVPRSEAPKVLRAAAKLAEAWLESHELRPLEFAAGKWRGGYLVADDADPLAPVYLPRAIVNGERRQTTVWTYSVEILTAEALIRRASRTEPPPAITVPISEEKHDPGVFGRLRTFIGRA